jgi:ribosome-associated protein
LKPSQSKEKAFLCARAALDHKAIDLVILSMESLSSFTDFFVICSGNSDRQVQAIASHIEDTLAGIGLFPLGIEGKREGRWILLDYGEVVVHIFYHAVREFYDLERLWADAQKIDLPLTRKFVRPRPRGQNCT